MIAVQQTFELQGILVLDAATDVELSCWNDPASNPVGAPKIGYADVLATQINAVSQSAQG